MKRSRFAVLLLLFVPSVAQTAAVPGKTPAVVYLMRHAEKPEGKENADLAPQGFKRAQALPTLFAEGRLRRPDVIFAAAPSKHSNRPIETITPLAQALHERVNADYDDIEAGPLAKQVLGGKYAGKVVVICWHHGEIPHVAEALGVADAPKKWDADVYDAIWKIEWVGGKATMTVVQEHLLPGDPGS